MSRLRASTVPVARVTAEQRDAMWAIFDRHYEGARRDRFELDLDGKDHVFLLTDGERLHGFSTVCTERLVVHGRSVVSIFSGDTVIDRAYHGQTALQGAFFRYIATARLRDPGAVVVWFLISKGYKTYLLLARNFVNFFPRRDRATPPWARALIDELAARRFGAAFDAERGILHFESDHERLRDHVAPAEGEVDPDIRFFVERNPAHAAGDELCCVGFVDLALLASYPLKLLRKRA